MSDITVKILVNGSVVSTQIVKRRSPDSEDAERAARGGALRAAILANEISISQSLIATTEIESKRSE